jgi:hypothetical protein
VAQIIAPTVVTPVYSIRIGGRMIAAGSTNNPAGNTLYYRLSTQVVAPTKTALNTIFIANIMAPLKLATNIRYTPTNTNIRNIQDASDPEVVFAVAGTGAIATDSEPSADAVVVALLSAARGPQGRCFKHFAGSSEVDTTGDILTGGSLVLWQNVRDAMKVPLTDALGNIWTPFVRCNFGAQYSTPPIIVKGYDVVGAYLQTIVGTMRRRKAAGVKST